MNELLVLLPAAIALSPAFAQDNDEAATAAEQLRKAVQNPVASLISIPIPEQ